MNMHIHKRFAPPQEVVHLLAQTYTFDPYAKNDPTRVLLPHSWQTLFLLPHNTKPMSGAFDWSWKHTKTRWVLPAKSQIRQRCSLLHWKVGCSKNHEAANTGSWRTKMCSHSTCIRLGNSRYCRWYPCPTHIKKAWVDRGKRWPPSDSGKT